MSQQDPQAASKRLNQLKQQANAAEIAYLKEVIEHQRRALVNATKRNHHLGQKAGRAHKRLEVRIHEQAEEIRSLKASRAEPDRNEPVSVPRRLSSAEWCKELDVVVQDADGWDRQNFYASWIEAISVQEFWARAARSTIRVNQHLSGV